MRNATWLAVLLLALGMLGATAIDRAHAAGELQDIVKRGEMRVGFIPSPPTTIKDPQTGELRGVYVDGLKAIAAEMGIKVDWVETTWGTFVAALQSGQIDLCIAGTFATVKRAMAVDFTRPIFYLGDGAIVRADDERFKTLKDMDRADVKIAVVQGGSAEEFARRNLPKAQLLSLSTGNLVAPFIEVVAHRADVGIEDVNNANKFAAQQPGAKVLFSDNPFNFLATAWTVRKGNSELLGVINVGIETLQSSGRWAALARPYGSTGRYIAMPVFADFPGELK